MAILDLQGMTVENGGGGHGGSSLTLLTCDSGAPSNLSVALCH